MINQIIKKNKEMNYKHKLTTAYKNKNKYVKNNTLSCISLNKYENMNLRNKNRNFSY